MLEFMEGSHAVAEIVKRCRPQVISAYPITPQTHIVEDLAQMVANCELDAEPMRAAMAECSLSTRRNLAFIVPSAQ